MRSQLSDGERRTESNTGSEGTVGELTGVKPDSSGSECTGTTWASNSSATGACRQRSLSSWRPRRPNGWSNEMKWIYINYQHYNYVIYEHSGRSLGWGAQEDHLFDQEDLLVSVREGGVRRNQGGARHPALHPLRLQPFQSGQSRNHQAGVPGFPVHLQRCQAPEDAGGPLLPHPRLHEPAARVSPLHDVHQVHRNHGERATAGGVPSEGQELRNHRVLRADRDRPWVGCSRTPNDRNLRWEDRRVRHRHSVDWGSQVLAWGSGNPGHSRLGVCRVEDQRSEVRDPPFHCAHSRQGAQPLAQHRSGRHWPQNRLL